jgi:hypothetical protein
MTDTKSQNTQEGYTTMFGVSVATLFNWVNIVYLIALAVTVVASGALWRLSILSTAQKDRELQAFQAASAIEIERAKEESSKANERSAALENETARLRATLSWRRITPEQHKTLVLSLKPNIPKEIDILWVQSDSETWRLAEDLNLAFTESGWTVWIYPMLISAVGVSVPGNDQSITQALQKADVPLMEPPTNTGVPKKPTIFVGSRPPPP